jgi:hypothetical protein
MKTLHYITLVLLVSLVSLPAKAALVQATDPRFGPNSLTIDTSTQLAWLDLTASAGLSYNQVINNTAPGGVLSGYRYATTDEVLGLFASAGIPGTGYYPLNNGPAQTLISLVGPTGTFQGQPEILGITGSGASGYQYSAEIYAFYYDTSLVYAVACAPGFLGHGFNQYEGYGAVGSWLVREVPEPSACFIMAGGLIGFAIMKRCGKKITLAQFRRAIQDCGRTP